MNLLSTSDPKIAAAYLGKIYTPPALASAVVKRALQMSKSTTFEVLEPSVGDGAFLTPLSEMLNPRSNITAVDIDDVAVSALRAKFSKSFPNENLINSDFLDFAIDHLAASSKNYDLIIGNPPFVARPKWQQASLEKADIIAKLAGLPKRELKNSWTLFLTASLSMLSENGVVAFVLPYELISTFYGRNTLEYCLKNSFLLEIYVAKWRAFPEIEQDTLVLFAKKTNRKVEGLKLRSVDRLDQLDKFQEKIVVAKQNSLDKANLASFVHCDNLSHVSTANEGTPKLLRIGEVADTAPGVVTGANDFFIVSEKTAKELCVLEKALPILRKSSYHNKLPIFESTDIENLHDRELDSLLLSIEREDVSKSEALAGYILAGEAQKLHERYKCRNREPWYKVPIPNNGTGFIFKRCHHHPRLLINSANVLTTDSAYSIRPKEGHTMRGICYSFYNSLTFLSCEQQGRFYGGGVLELTPSEFRNVQMAYKEPSDQEFEEFIKLFDNGDIKAVLDYSDKWLAEYLGLSRISMVSYRNAWKEMRTHRMRHQSNAIV